MSKYLLRKQTLWLLIVLILAACTSQAGESSTPATIVVEAATATPVAGDVLIRVHNQTGLDLERISVQFPSQTEEFGPLADGTGSDFYLINEAYRYAFIQVTSGGSIYVLQPIDYVGESLLAPGHYTYILGLSDSNVTVDLAEGEELLPTEPTLEVMTMYVSAETAACVGVSSQTCLLVKFAQADEWQLLPENIEGFVQEPGYEYELRVYKLTYENPPADASAVQYKLVEHVQRTAVATTQPLQTPTDTPESIFILNPGPLSQITNPITIAGESDYAFEGTLEVQIVSFQAEGTVVVGSGFAMLNVSEIGQRGPYSGVVEFTPPTEPTPGRVIVTITSPRDGHVDHLASVPVTLLPAGETAVINPATPQPEAIAIHSPVLLDTISGGTVHITGFAASTFEQNLVIEILNENGMVVGSGFTTIAAGMGEYGPFEVEVDYSVTAENNGSVCVQDVDALDGNLIHRTCVTVTLLP